MTDKQDEYEILVQQTYVWKKTIKAASEEDAAEIAEDEWRGDTVDWEDGADAPPDWSEVRSVSGEFEVI